MRKIRSNEMSKGVGVVFILAVGLICDCFGADSDSLKGNGQDNTSVKKSSKDILEDSNLSVDKLIRKYGYNAEVHKVTTEDGYILTMHRIRKDGGKPFFLQHGLVDSSAGFVLMGPNVSLAYLLSDLKYDVWMGNARGNRYSRNHTTLDPIDGDFWEFSWHEIGFYDLPAMINYVLKTTRHDKLLYAGHSQGCTAFFVMCSMRPEYNKKIIQMHALAPAAYLSHANNHPYVRIVDLFLRSPMGALATEMFSGELRFLCRVSREAEFTCIQTIFSLIGRNDKEFNREKFPIILGHYPAGASAKQIEHFLQLINTGRFAQFNYGYLDNLAKYHQTIPPKYDLGKVTAPVYIIYSLNDLLVRPPDVDQLYSELKNPIGKYIVPMKDFNHLDYLWATNVRKLVYEKMIKILKRV